MAEEETAADAAEEKQEMEAETEEAEGEKEKEEEEVRINAAFDRFIAVYCMGSWAQSGRFMA